MIEILERIITNNFLILVILVLGYFGRESIKNFFAEKLWDKQQEYNIIRDKEQRKFNEERDRKQEEFQRELSRQNVTLQKELQAAIEKQRIEFQKELQSIEYKNGYYNKILDKRINAYEELNELVLNATLISKINKYEYYSMFSSYEKFSVHYEKLKTFSKNFIWYSQEIVDLLNRYIIVLSSIDSYNRGSILALTSILVDLKVDINLIVNIEKTLKNINTKIFQKDIMLPIEDEKLCSAGIVCHNIIGNLHLLIITALKNDFKELYKVEEFLNKK